MNIYKSLYVFGEDLNVRDWLYVKNGWRMTKRKGKMIMDTSFPEFEYWFDSENKAHKISEMSEEYINHCIDMIKREKCNPS